MRISVIIPMLNAESYVAQAVRSVLNQSLAAHEIFVVDNGSTDAGPDIIQAFGAPVRLLHEAEPGACAARLKGAAEASGEALMFLDADDLLGPTVLEELAGVLRSAPGAIACCPWRRYELDGQCWRVRPASCPPRRRGEHLLSAWLRGWYHPPCSVLWSRAAYLASGGWDPAIASNQDGDLMMRALVAGIRLEFANGGTSFYRRLPGDAVSLSGRRFTPEGLTSRIMVVEKIENELKQCGQAGRFRGALREAYLGLANWAKDVAPDIERRAQKGISRNRLAPLRDVLDLLRRKASSVGGNSSYPEHPPVASRRPRPDLAIPADPPALVTVIIPTFNRADTTIAAVESVLSQTFTNFELLVVDDASTDETAVRLSAIDDPRVQILRQHSNQGVAAARNRGIAEARGALIAFLDSDDLWHEDKLYRQVKLAQRRPDVVAVFNTGAIERFDHGDVEWRAQARGDLHSEMLHRNALHVTTSSALIRREVFETVGLFDEKLPANEDHDLWTRAAIFYQFDAVPDPLIVYTHQSSGSEAESSRRSRNFRNNIQARLDFLDLHGVEARRAGVKHLYHLDIARRHIESPDGDVGSARGHLVRAIRHRPGDLRIYLWLIFAMFPAQLRSLSENKLKQLWRGRS